MDGFQPFCGAEVVVSKYCICNDTILKVRIEEDCLGEVNVAEVGAIEDSFRSDPRSEDPPCGGPLALTCAPPGVAMDKFESSGSPHRDWSPPVLLR